MRTAKCSGGKRGLSMIAAGSPVVPVSPKTTGQNAQKGHPVTMPRVHVGLDLKYKPGKGFVRGLKQAAVLLKWAGLGRQLQKGLEKRFDAEVIERAAEEYRREISCEKTAPIEGVPCSRHQRDVLTQLITERFAQERRK